MGFFSATKFGRVVGGGGGMNTLCITVVSRVSAHGRSTITR